jgi:hypothetical protein
MDKNIAESRNNGKCWRKESYDAFSGKVVN